MLARRASSELRHDSPCLLKAESVSKESIPARLLFSAATEIKRDVALIFLLVNPGGAIILRMLVVRSR